MSATENHLAGRIRQLRAAKGMSQERLAWASQVTKQTIANLEHGRSVPRLDTLARLAAGLGITASELISEEAQSA